MTSEFDLIAHYFSRAARNASIGVGDDAAMFKPATGCEVLVTTDTLVSGTHFFPDTDPSLLGHKALAVNLSDLAAMGVQPRCVVLALTLPEFDKKWLAQFAEGFYGLAEHHRVDLIGGDTTRGPLSITVTAIGEAERGKVLRRNGACIGDDVWVSGQIGSAALALAQIKGEVNLDGVELEQCTNRLLAPVPRVELGRELSRVAHAAIDVSDGLLADAGHIAAGSGVGMELAYGDVPCIAGVIHRKSEIHVRRALLAGGDDYELLFTASSQDAPVITEIANRLRVTVTRIGRVVDGSGILVRDDDGGVIDMPMKGYDHFA